MIVATNIPMEKERINVTATYVPTVSVETVGVLTESHEFKRQHIYNVVVVMETICMQGSCTAHQQMHAHVNIRHGLHNTIAVTSGVNH